MKVYLPNLLCQPGILPIFALFSGGNDSHVSTHVAMEGGAHEVIHIKTGIGIPATTEHMIAACEKQGWPYRIIEPPDKTFRDFVRKYGFPGPAAHRYSYVWLKERALQTLRRDSKNILGRVVLSNGVRNSESARRMGYNSAIQRQGSLIWLAPIFGFSKIDVHDYMKDHGLERNPVTDILGFSGECLCGAFAQPNEIAKIDKHFPETGAQIHALEAEVKELGKHCVWGTRPPRSRPFNPKQMTFMPTCASCPSHVAPPSQKEKP